MNIVVYKVSYNNIKNKNYRTYMKEKPANNN